MYQATAICQHLPPKGCKLDRCGLWLRDLTIQGRRQTGTTKRLKSSWNWISASTEIERKQQVRSEELEGGEFRREGTGKEGKEHLSWKVSWLLGGEANGIESRSLRWRWISASMDGKGGEGIPVRGNSLCGDPETCTCRVGLTHLL